MRQRQLVGLGLVVVVSLLIGVGLYLLFPPAPNLSETFTSNSFRFRYPEGWQYQIPQTNMLFLASPEVLVNQPGATLTIQRAIRLAPDSDTLEGNLQFYLDRGALAFGKSWTVVDAIQAIQFAEREAFFVALEGSEIADTVEMRSETYITRADNRFMHLFTFTAPLDQWDTIKPTLDAIIASVEILE